MIYVNLALGLAAVALMSLVLRGTIGHVLARHRDMSLKTVKEMDAPDLIRLGIGIWHIGGITRIIMWDVWLLLLLWSRGSLFASINSAFCLLAIGGSLCILAAFYRNIPEEDRSHYSWLTASWYPSPPPLLSRGK